MPQWRFRCFLVSVLGSHGAQLQQDGEQCPSPACSSPQAKEALVTHLLCSPWQLSPAASVLLPACMWYLRRTRLLAPFLSGKAASVKKCEQLFGEMGIGRISGKKAVLTRTCFLRGSWCFSHSCLLDLESLLSFCYAGKAANAALAFYPDMFRSGFSSNQYVLFSGESLLQ